MSDDDNTSSDALLAELLRRILTDPVQYVWLGPKRDKTYLTLDLSVPVSDDERDAIERLWETE